MDACIFVMTEHENLDGILCALRPKALPQSLTPTFVGNRGTALRNIATQPRISPLPTSYPKAWTRSFPTERRLRFCRFT